MFFVRRTLTTYVFHLNSWLHDNGFRSNHWFTHPHLLLRKQNSLYTNTKKGRNSLSTRILPCDITPGTATPSCKEFSVFGSSSVSSGIGESNNEFSLDVRCEEPLINNILYYVVCYQGMDSGEELTSLRGVRFRETIVTKATPYRVFGISPGNISLL